MCLRVYVLRAVICVCDFSLPCFQYIPALHVMPLSSCDKNNEIDLLADNAGTGASSYLREQAEDKSNSETRAYL